MVTKKCLNCRKEFRVFPYEENTAKYCSRSCSSIATKNGFQKGHPCFNTGRTYFKKGHIPWAKLNPDKMPRGKDNGSWKGGKYQKENGRWFIRKLNHPFVSKNGYVLRSHLVAEKYLGRYLTREEVIHHINNDPSDDRSENLYLFPLQANHTRFQFSKTKPSLTSNLV